MTCCITVNQTLSQLKRWFQTICCKLCSLMTHLLMLTSRSSGSMALFFLGSWWWVTEQSSLLLTLTHTHSIAKLHFMFHLMCCTPYARLLMLPNDDVQTALFTGKTGSWSPLMLALAFSQTHTITSLVVCEYYVWVTLDELSLLNGVFTNTNFLLWPQKHCLFTPIGRIILLCISHKLASNGTLWLCVCVCML